MPAIGVCRILRILHLRFQMIDKNLMGRLLYASAKIHAAVYEFAIGEGDAKSRLKYGVNEYFFRVTERDMPSELKEQFVSIRSRLEKEPATHFPEINVHYSSFDNTVKKMRNKTASKIIQHICELKFNLDQYLEELEE